VVGFPYRQIYSRKKASSAPADDYDLFFDEVKLRIL